MWAFSGGSHYNVDFEKFEKSFISKKLKNFKKKCFNNNFQFVAISDWLQKEAKRSLVLKDRDIKKIYNNIDLSKFKIIAKKEAKEEKWTIRPLRSRTQWVKRRVTGCP